ncbi:MAG: CRISPR-associated endonuclease Cas1 [Wenzhouxiangellaceae bacterium]|nr:CRISPR-associated endonuclease Cas1 [Wenzhouxiangellaceae bacterium]
MRDVHVEGHGAALALTGQRLKVRLADGRSSEVALNRVRSVTVHGPATSLSGAALLALAARGIHLTILGRGGQDSAMLLSSRGHATARVRAAQFQSIEDDAQAARLCKELVATKVRNQRAVLLYFAKYSARRAPDRCSELKAAGEQLIATLAAGDRVQAAHHANWRERYFGVEGHAANLYWAVLRTNGLLPGSFERRIGRGASEVTNSALNYGYAILESRVQAALLRAGLEIHAGFFHRQRPGKPSLVLDMMEIFRPWVVDRSVIKLRRFLDGKTELDAATRKRLTGEVSDVFSRRYPYRGRRVSLDSILQRQCYRLAGTFCDGRAFKGYRFAW